MIKYLLILLLLGCNKGEDVFEHNGKLYRCEQWSENCEYVAEISREHGGYIATSIRRERLEEPNENN